ncbi:hypothetical protein [Nocardia brasiliensis]|uniref:hypothetical protein n=1 Tax=Nocardia brasiliensis TaxID=37326 RepID=UPI0004A6BA5F|nr:hypothetical protein [Nocardia brasiliensis]MBF6129123.1 hypothetical protein [Nocardia brasiliensis]MBF6545610.1 hypothetical protein [Nocardia brasiliensis]
MRTTFPTSVSAAAMTAAAQEYTQRGWTVAETANGLCLITDDELSAIEVSGELAGQVRRFLRANNLSGPVIEIPGTERREIHLVTGVRKAAMALAALTAAGAVVHTDGAGVPLPPTQLSAGSACWGVAPTEARWVPPVVALSAAVRAATARSKPQLTSVAC